MAKISAIIPTIKGREEMLQRLLDSLPANVEKIVVPDEFHGWCHTELSAKRNKGAVVATGEYLLFIDDDNFCQEGAVEKMAQYLRDDVGIVGMMACYYLFRSKIADGGSKRHDLIGFTRGINTNKMIYDIDPYPYEVNEVANAFMIKRELFWKLNGFDTYRFPTELDEADLCIRVSLMGYKIMMIPMAICYHRSITYSCIPDFRRPKNAYFMGRNRILLQKKHLGVDWYDVYAMVFMPIFVLSYTLCLLCRRKPGMVFHFLKGVFDGLRNRLENTYQ